ncbi:hypothetical protein J7J95_02395 [bacterium]|nr:hypothetical protein [bacterium]
MKKVAIWATIVVVVLGILFGVYKLGMARGTVSAKAELTPTPTAILETDTTVSINTPAATATATPAAEKPAEKPVIEPPCLNGEVVWSDSTSASGYGLSPVGGLNENRWIVGETWYAPDGDIKSYVFVIPPHTVAWISNHRGGTAWALCVNSRVKAVAVANENIRNLIERDGITPTLIVLPDDAANFPLLDHLQTR